MQLEAHLAEVHRQSQRMIERQSKLGLSMSEFGASMVALGKFESGTLAQKFTKLGERADSLSGASQVRLFTTHASALNQVHSFKCTHSSALIQKHSFKCRHRTLLESVYVSVRCLCALCAVAAAGSRQHDVEHFVCWIAFASVRTHLFLYVWLQKQSEQLMTTFEAPLKEFVRAVKSAKSVMTDRSSALGLLQQVRAPGLIVDKHILANFCVCETCHYDCTCYGSRKPSMKASSACCQF